MMSRWESDVKRFKNGGVYDKVLVYDVLDYFFYQFVFGFVGVVVVNVFGFQIEFFQEGNDLFSFGVGIVVCCCLIFFQKEV